MKGRRVVWPDAGQVEVEDFEITPPGEFQVLVDTIYTLISPGTERAFLIGLPNTSKNYPFYPGYCNVGEVIEVGNGVEDFRLGDRVASRGNHDSLVTINKDKALKIPNEAPSDEAVFFNLCAIALQGVRKAKIDLGEAVLVLGQGLIGQLALQLARLDGGFPAIGADVASDRLELALRLGADVALNPKDEDFEGKLSEATEGKGPIVVIEATGSPEPINRAFQLARLWGRVVLLASTRGETPEVNFYRDVHKKGLTVIGAHDSVRPFQESSANYWTWQDDGDMVLRLMAHKRLKISELISHRLSGEKAPEAYQLLSQWRSELMGVVLEW